MTEQDLPEAEIDVMSCLWKGGPATAREIREALQDRRPLNHASVCTLLRRLESKGFVSREKSGTGKAFRYRAEVPASGTARRLLDGLLDRLFGGNGVALVASLLESRPPSGDEIDALEDLLKDLKKKQTTKSTRRSKR
jgi:BlaI family penicillinase repressor